MLSEPKRLNMIWPLSIFIQNKSQILFLFREFIKILDVLGLNDSFIFDSKLDTFLSV